MKTFFLTVSIGIFVIIVVVNVLISQAVSPFFPAITLYKDVDQTVLFLKNIRTSAEFSTQLAYFESIYGSTVKDRVFSEDQKRLTTIKSLEEILSQNPNSTDILVSLSQLHRANGEAEIAKQYFGKAQQIDPWIK